MLDQASAPASGRAAAAIESARCGLRVFPVVPGGKKPLRRGWRSSATADPAVVEVTWAGIPDANIGVACGNGLIVVDADSRAGERALCELGLPDTPTVRTGRGRHIYLAGESRNRVRVLPGVDIRGSGGYVVGAGSLHPNGATYRWETSPGEVKLAPAPESLLALLAESACKRSVTLTVALGRIEHGTRNATLFRLACSLRGRVGFAYEELLAALGTVNTHRCAPPLEHAEVERIARSASSYESAPAWVTDPVAFACDPRIRAPARWLLVALARYADHEGVCWPGIRRLHADTGLATDTIQGAVEALIAAGRIEVFHRRGQSNLYRLQPRPETAKAPESGSSVLHARTPGAGA